jgi:hypothetical protein
MWAVNCCVCNNARENILNCQWLSLVQLTLVIMAILWSWLYTDLRTTAQVPVVSDTYVLCINSVTVHMFNLCANNFQNLTTFSLGSFTGGWWLHTFMGGGIDAADTSPTSLPYFSIDNARVIYTKKFWIRKKLTCAVYIRKVWEENQM